MDGETVTPLWGLLIRDVRRKSNAGSIGLALQLLRKESCRRVALFMKYIHVFHLREERLGHPLDVQILS
tara:strand:- start:517 stop:723 length:207 start_codon:yes stop_codon:yes gene_type:complete